MREKDQLEADPSHQVEDWIGLQIHLAVREISPQRTFSDLEKTFLTKFHEQHTRQRKKKWVGVGSGVGVGAGVAADAWLGVEWMEMIESLLAWIGKSVGLAASFFVP